MSSAELARAIYVERATVSMWETGARARRAAASLDSAERVSVGLGLSTNHAAALVGLWQSAGTLTAIAPRTAWSHNYQPPSDPVWAWLRPGPIQRRLVASLWWGEPLQGRLEADAPPNGLLVQFPTSVPNPPLEIRLADPGWVDFGRGQIPQEIADRIGAQLVYATGLMTDRIPVDPQLPADHERQLRPWFARARALADRFGLKWSLVAPHLGYAWSERPPQALDGADLESMTWPGAVTTDSLGLIASQLRMSPGQARELRVARGLSREAAAARATALNPVEPVSHKMIEAIETRGHVPEVKDALIRLDTVYGADGRLGVDQTFSSRSWAHHPRSRQQEVGFPEYWRGPVWIQAIGPSPGESGMVDLTWGAWRRRQRIRSGAVVTTRKATADAPPLRVRAPAGWEIVGGAGVMPAALDISRGWYPVSVRAAIVLLREGVEAVRLGLARSAQPLLRPGGREQHGHAKWQSANVSHLDLARRVSGARRRVLAGPVVERGMRSSRGTGRRAGRDSRNYQRHDRRRGISTGFVRSPAGHPAGPRRMSKLQIHGYKGQWPASCPRVCQAWVATIKAGRAAIRAGQTAYAAPPG